MSIREAITPDRGTPFARVAALESALYMRNQLLRDIDLGEHGAFPGSAHSSRRCFSTTRDRAGGFHGSSPRWQTTAREFAPHPLPQEILERKKTGFTVPINAWLEREHKEVPHSFGMRPWALYLYQRALA